MADRDDILAQYAGPSLTTADVIRAMPYEGDPLDLKAQMRDRAMRGQKMSPEMTARIAPDPERKANLPWLRSALDAANEFSPAAMFAASFVGPKVAPLPAGRTPIRGHHGSAHDFAGDKFQAEKIGSGEGNAVFGHGHYFAGNPKTAEWYRKRLGGDSNAFLEYAVKPPGGGPPLVFSGRHGQLPDGIAPELHHATNLLYWDKARKAKSLTKQWLQDAHEGKGVYPDRGVDYYQRLYDYVRQINPKDIDVRRGRMYDVDLHVAPEQMLSWDSPLGKQSGFLQDTLMPFAQKRADMMNEARQRVLERGTYSLGSKPLTPERRAELSKRVDPAEIDGQKLYKMMQLEKGAKAEGQFAKEASEAFLDMGVPGVQYLDQLSRGRRSAKTSNYVMFPGTEDLIEIIRRRRRGGKV
jgi:hypothetical protein